MRAAKLAIVVFAILAGGTFFAAPAVAQSIFDGATPSYFGWSCGPEGDRVCPIDFAHAADMSAGGGVVAGSMFVDAGIFDLEDPARRFEDSYWAVAWTPDAASGGPQTGITLLPNPEPGADAEGTNRAFDSVLDSFAYDVNGAGTQIVGSADVGNTVGDLLPLLWTWNGASFDTPLVLPTVTGEVSEDLPYQGEALAINDAGTFITGWNGDPNQDRFDIFDYHAVRWSLTTPGGTDWTVDELSDAGLIGDQFYGEDGNSVGEDINADGTVIVGRYASTEQPLLFSVEPLLLGPTDLIPIDLPPTDLFVPFGITRPFVWTEQAGQMKPLALPEISVFTSLNGDQPSLDAKQVGDARALNPEGSSVPSGSVAVGWSGYEDFGPENTGDGVNYAFEATRWSTGDNWADPSDPAGVKVLGFVEPDPLPSGFGDITMGERLGSVANAVDASGNVIVGQVDFSVTVPACGGDCNSEALFSEATIWEAGDGSFPGRTLQAALGDAGVDIGTLWLTRATGVRVTYDGDLPTDIVIIGDAIDTSSILDPIFLVRLGVESGITTLPDQQESFSSVASLLDQVTDDVAGPLFGLGDVVLHDLCMRPQEGHSQQPWCFFAFGTGTAYTDLTGSEFVGDVGLGHYFNPSDSAAFSIGANHLDVHLDDDSAKFEGTGYHIGAYVAHKPELGFQAFAAGTIGWWNDVDISRTYANGTGTATSSGSTDGTAYGALGWLGYAFKPAPRVITTPFAQLTYLATHFDGWTESGGPFPASFGSTSGSSTDLRLGVDSSYQWDGATKVFGSAAWVHRLDGDGHVVTGSLLAAGCDTSAPLSAFCGIEGKGPDRPADWFEGTLGVRRNLAANQVVSLSGTVDAGADFTALSARIGYSKSF